MKFEELTALYSPLDQEYNQVMSGPYEDLSHHDDDCKVIAALKNNRITGFWRPAVACGGDKALKLQIERLYDICPNISYMDFLIDGRLSVISQFLLRHGHKARPYFTQIIDLTKDMSRLRAEMRKSYRSLVNKRDGLLRGSVKDMQHFSETIKGTTRPQETWGIQEKMKEAGQAFCVFDEWPAKSGAMFYVNQCCAYYASATSLPSTDSHAVVWEGIVICKAVGCKFVEMGEQVFSGDPKLMNISKFKRGMGGRTITRLILEKGCG